MNQNTDDTFWLVRNSKKTNVILKVIKLDNCYTYKNLRYGTLIAG